MFLCLNLLCICASSDTGASMSLSLVLFCADGSSVLVGILRRFVVNLNANFSVGSLDFTRYTFAGKTKLEIFLQSQATQTPVFVKATKHWPVICYSLFSPRRWILTELPLFDELQELISSWWLQFGDHLICLVVTGSKAAHQIAFLSVMFCVRTLRIQVMMCPTQRWHPTYFNCPAWIFLCWPTFLRQPNSMLLWWAQGIRVPFNSNPSFLFENWGKLFLWNSIQGLATLNKTLEPSLTHPQDHSMCLRENNQTGFPSFDPPCLLCHQPELWSWDH